MLIENELLKTKLKNRYVESNGSYVSDFSMGKNEIIEEALQWFSELEQAAIAEAEKRKLVWVNENDYYTFTAQYNINIKFCLAHKGDYIWKVTVSLKGLSIDIGCEKTFELAKQACEQFLTDLLTPTPNE